MYAEKKIVIFVFYICFYCSMIQKLAMNDITQENA